MRLFFTWTYLGRTIMLEFNKEKENLFMDIASPKEVEKCLQGVDYPAKKQDLIQHAKAHGADQRVMETLQQLPEENFQSPVGVSKAIGEIGHRGGPTR
ncbi:MAG TPA: DUF2795 domain-containing protein [Ktedonobacteraceae bacterium]|nr:DUF2795 domain-containing protein [Ktedonobacteraceae bacterium]